MAAITYRAARSYTCQHMSMHATTRAHRHERAVTAAQIDQIWRLPRAAYMHRFGRA